jgi:thiol-disulfide isomerase/thioredoxin
MSATPLRAAMALLAAGAFAACTSESSSPADEANADTGAVADTGTVDDAGGTPDAPAEERCVYPTNNGNFAYDEVVPDVFWSPAFNGAGDEVIFDLYDFYCSDEYDAYDTLIVLVSAGWCPNCPRLIRWLDLLQDRLEQEGAMVLLVEAETTTGGTAYSDDAQEHFAQFAPDGVGIRVGDGDGEPANAIYESALVNAFPTSFVIRRSDMRVIASGDRSDYILPFVEIAMDPEADWSSPPPPEIVPEFSSNCENGADDEEAAEPNNDEGTATPLPVGTLNAAICDGSPDYFAIDIEGSWTLSMAIEASGNTADLDMGVIDPETGNILGAPDAPVGSFGSTTTEEFSHSGPAVVIVQGYRGSTSPYTLTLTAN